MSSLKFIAVIVAASWLIACVVSHPLDKEDDPAPPPPPPPPPPHPTPHGGEHGEKHGEKHGERHGEKGEKHGDCPRARAREFYARHVQCRSCVTLGMPGGKGKHNNNVEMKWCAAPGAKNDGMGKCIPKTEVCAVDHVEIFGAASCPNDVPESKPTCSLCVLDGYTWCQDRSVEWDEYSGSCVAAPPSLLGEESPNDDVPPPMDGETDSSVADSSTGGDQPQPRPGCPCAGKGKVIRRLDQCASFANQGKHGWQKMKSHAKWAWIVPVALCVCLTCCCKRRCKRRCQQRREQWRQRCEQWQQRCGQGRCGQAANAATAANASSSPAPALASGCASYPGAVSVAVSSTPTPIAVPVVVATPASAATAPLLYSHDPQPAYIIPATTTSVAPVEVEMRQLASPTSVMYPTVSGNGYTSLPQNE
jgi:hypothetical protein